MIWRGRRQESWDEREAYSIARRVKQDRDDAASICLVRYPCPDNADKDTDQNKEDEADGVERAQFTGNEKAGQVPDCPYHAENNGREPRAESLLKMRQGKPSSLFPHRWG